MAISFELFRGGCLSVIFSYLFYLWKNLRFWTLRSKEFFLYLSFLCIFSLCFFKSFSSANQSRASFITSIKQSLVQAQLKALSQGSAKKQNSFFIRFLSLVLSFFTPYPLPREKRGLLQAHCTKVFRYENDWKIGFFGLKID